MDEARSPEEVWYTLTGTAYATSKKMRPISIEALSVEAYRGNDYPPSFYINDKLDVDEVISGVVVVQLAKEA